MHVMAIFVKPRLFTPSHDYRSGATNRYVTLSKDEWKRRVDAALSLRGEELGDLRHVVKEKGLPLNAAARAGHDSDAYEPNHALALVLAEITELPVAWFEVEDWRSLISEEAVAAGDPGDEAGKLKAERSLLLSMIAQVRSELEDLRKHPRPQ